MEPQAIVDIMAATDTLLLVSFWVSICTCRCNIKTSYSQCGMLAGRKSYGHYGEAEEQQREWQQELAGGVGEDARCFGGACFLTPAPLVKHLLLVW